MLVLCALINRWRVGALVTVDNLGMEVLLIVSFWFWLWPLGSVFTR